MQTNHKYLCLERPFGGIGSVRFQLSSEPRLAKSCPRLSVHDSVSISIIKLLIATYSACTVAAYLSAFSSF